MRSTTSDAANAWFSVREIDVGMTADVGTLQRLPILIGEGMARELAYTGRRVDGAEAREMRLVNRCLQGMPLGRRAEADVEGLKLQQAWMKRD